MLETDNRTKTNTKAVSPSDPDNGDIADGFAGIADLYR